MSDFILPEYHMVAEGLMPPPAERRFWEMRFVTTNFDRLLPQAVEKVYEAVRFNAAENPKPRGWVSALDFIERELRIRWPDGSRHWYPEKRARYADRIHNTAISLVLDVAKTSTRYWGVDDPSEESYCSYCKGPKPLAEFNKSRFTCDPCFDSRRETHPGGE